MFAWMVQCVKPSDNYVLYIKSRQWRRSHFAVWITKTNPRCQTRLYHRYHTWLRGVMDAVPGSCKPIICEAERIRTSCLLGDAYAMLQTYMWSPYSTICTLPTIIIHFTQPQSVHCRSFEHWIDSTLIMEAFKQKTEETSRRRATVSNELQNHIMFKPHSPVKGRMPVYK